MDGKRRAGANEYRNILRIAGLAANSALLYCSGEEKPINEKYIIPLLILILILIVFTTGCNSAKNAGGGSGTSMQGTWTVTGNLQCTQGCASGVSNTYQVALVSSPCSVTTPVGMFSVQGPVCFIANNNTGEGSISGTGIPNSPKSTGHGVLITVDQAMSQSCAVSSPFSWDFERN